MSFEITGDSGEETASGRAGLIWSSVSGVKLVKIGGAGTEVC